MIREALGDYVKVAGRIPLPPRFAFGTWWSRYWDYSDQEIEEIIHGFRQNSTPLDVFVIDMGWHISLEQLKAMGQATRTIRISRDIFSDGQATRGTRCSSLTRAPFLDRLHRRDHLKTMSEPASSFWHSAVGSVVSRDGKGDGHRSGNKTVRSVRHHQ